MHGKQGLRDVCECLQGAYGDNVDIKHFQLNPRTPVQQVFDRLKELEARASEFEAEKQGAATAYEAYAVAKTQECKFPSNTVPSSNNGA